LTFFDKKEEVMKIELTPYGRYLLSIGKLKPHSYRFFDENIIYNCKSGDFIEGQNDAHHRITNETPTLKGNPNVTGVETNIRKFESEEVYLQNMRTPTTDDTISSNNESVGTSDYNTNDSSYFSVDLFRSKFIESEIKQTYSTKGISEAGIPQLPINFFLSGSIEYDDSFDDATELEPNFNYVQTESFQDGSYILLRWEDPLVRIKELNSFDEKDNFVMTAYKVRKTNEEVSYTRLRFPKRQKKIINNILIDEEQMTDRGGIPDFNTTNPELNYGAGTPNDITYYLGFLFDKEIPDSDICSTIGDLDIRNIFLDEKIECPDELDEDPFDIYGSRVTEEDLEEC